MLALWAFFVVRGHKRGFLRSALTTFSFVIAIVLASALTAPVSNMLENSSFGSRISENVSESIDEKLSEYAEELSLGEDEQDSFLESLALPSIVRDSLKETNTAEDYAQMGVTSFKEYTAQKVTDVIINAAAYIIVMVIAAIVLKIILRLAKFVNKIPVIGGINRFLGALLGVFEGLLVLWAIGLAIIVFSNTAFGIKAVSIIQSNAFLNAVFDNNLLVAMFSALF